MGAQTGADAGTDEATATGGPRLGRRHLLRGAALAGAALAGARPAARAAARQPAGSAPAAARRQSGRITLALTTDDLPRVQPLLAEFAAETGIAVEPAAFPYAELYARLTVELTLGSCAYDVVSVDDPWMPLLAGERFLADLDDLAGREGIDLATPDFVPSFLDLGRSAGVPGLRAVPWIGNVQLYAWRQDALEALGLDRPQTWDAVLAAATAVRDAPPVPGLHGVGLRGEPGNSAATTFLPILRGHGVDLFDASWEPQLGTPQAAAAMRALLALAPLAPPGVETTGHDQLGRHLQDGLVAQAADIWPNQLDRVFTPGLTAASGKVAIGAEPAQVGAQPGGMTGVWLLGLPEGCGGNARPALEFVRWLTAPERQTRLMLEAGLPATRQSVLADARVAADLPYLPGLLEAARAAVPRPRTIHYPAVEEILGRWVADAIAGRAAGDAALAAANAEIRALMVRQGELAG